MDLECRLTRFLFIKGQDGNALAFGSAGTREAWPGHTLPCRGATGREDDLLGGVGGRGLVGDEDLRDALAGAALVRGRGRGRGEVKGRTQDLAP